MVTIPQAISGVADVLEIPVARVNTRGQKLREARLLPVTGRGIGASHLDAIHVVRIVLAAMVPDLKLADTVDRVKFLEGLRGWEGSIDPGRHPRLDDMKSEGPRSLMAAPTLGDAFVELIKNIAGGGFNESGNFRHIEFAININGENTTAIIKVRPSDKDDRYGAFELEYQAGELKWVPITTTISVATPVFKGLAELLYGKDENAAEPPAPKAKDQPPKRAKRPKKAKPRGGK